MRGIKAFGAPLDMPDAPEHVCGAGTEQGAAAVKGRTGPKGTAGSKARGSMVRTDDPTLLKVQSPGLHVKHASSLEPIGAAQ